MGILSKFLGGAAAEPINAVGNVLDDLFTSDEEKLSLEVVKQRLAQKPALAQSEIMKAQAQHRSVFVAGARPFLMWVCGFGLLFCFIINPIIQWATGQAGPDMPLDSMMELTIAMLGLAGLRTYEKKQGLTK